MITNVPHLIIWSIVINVVSLIYISVVIEKILSHDKSSSVSLYVTENSEKIGETYTKVMFGLNIFVLLFSIIFLIYSMRPSASEGKKIKWLGFSFYLIISLLYIILSSLWIESDISSHQLLNDQFIVYIVIGSFQLIFTLFYYIKVMRNKKQLIGE